MRGFLIFALCLCCVGVAEPALCGAEYHLLNGNVVKGEAVSFNEEGVVVRLDIGGYSPRISWSQLTQDALKAIVKNPQAAPYADPFIEIPPEVKAKERAKKRHVDVKPVPRVELPAKAKGNALFTTPAGLTILGLLFLANLFAAYEIALYRNRPPAVVCCVSAILPVLGPILFLAMPPASEPEYAPELAADETEAAAPGAAEEPAHAGGSLSLKAKTGPAAAGVAPGVVYRRGETTFNRRFFEGTFPGFFRVVAGETEKDLVLVVKTARGEFVAKRISRISMNEMHLILLRGGSEVNVPFAEVIEAQVRHKDAKP